jgi:peptide/nickel transport system permease protein
MMLDQNENSEQLALIKKKYGFDKPIAPSIYTISMTSHTAFTARNESDYTYLSRENTMQHRYSV